MSLGALGCRLRHIRHIKLNSRHLFSSKQAIAHKVMKRICTQYIWGDESHNKHISRALTNHVNEDDISSYTSTYTQAHIIIYINQNILSTRIFSNC